MSEKLASIALDIGAIKLSPSNPFTWASGYRMPIYNDNRLLLSDASFRKLIVDEFQQLLKTTTESFDVVAGTATAGIPHATSLADRLLLPLIYVRSKPKGHGLKQTVEGALHPNQKVLLIEDLISTGKSSLAAVKDIRQAGGDVSVCLAIFTYGFKAAEEAFKSASCQAYSILKFDTVLAVARERELLSDEQIAIISNWNEDPFSWGESNGFPKIVRE